MIQMLRRLQALSAAVLVLVVVWQPASAAHLNDEVDGNVDADVADALAQVLGEMGMDSAGNTISAESSPSNAATFAAEFSAAAAAAPVSLVETAVPASLIDNAVEAALATEFPDYAAASTQSETVT